MANVTSYECTRNDGYLVTKREGLDLAIVSYGKNLVDRINSLKVLDDMITEGDFNDSIKFRKIIAELDEKGYYVFQLTRL